MKTSWADDPIGLFAAAVQSTVGGILLSIAAWICGAWVYISPPFDWFKYGFPDKNALLDDLTIAMTLIPFSSAYGMIGGTGIPFIIIQWICAYQIVRRDETRLHRCFLVAYSQVLLAYTTEPLMGDFRFSDSHAFNCLQGLLILAFAHLICVFVLYLHYRLSQRH